MNTITTEPVTSVTPPWPIEHYYDRVGDITLGLVSTFKNPLKRVKYCSQEIRGVNSIFNSILRFRNYLPEVFP